MNKFFDLFGRKKVVIGMLHLAGSSPKDRIYRALEETRIYEEGGLDGVIVEDYHGNVEDVRLTLESLSRQEKPRIKIGVNVLKNPYLGFEFARKYGARFVQIDSVQSTDLHPAEHDRMREKYKDIVVLGGVQFKYKKSTGNKLEKDLVEAMPRCDAIVTTGEGTGIETPMEKLRDFRQSLSWLGGFPLISGAGVTADNVMEQIGVCDGIIVGSYFKGGRDKTHLPINRNSIKRLMDAVRAKS